MTTPLLFFVGGLVLVPSCTIAGDCDLPLDPGLYEIEEVWGEPQSLLGGEVETDGTHLWIRWTDEHGARTLRYRIEE